MRKVTLNGTGVSTSLIFDGPVDGSIAGSSLVVARYKNRLLMIYNSKRKGWEFPGGKLLPGECKEDCAKREFMEETGLVTGRLSVICNYEVETQHQIHRGSIYSCTISRFKPIINNMETLGIGLFSDPPELLSIHDGYIEYMFNLLLYQSKR